MTQLKKQLFNKLEASSNLLALLPNTNSIMPQVKSISGTPTIIEPTSASATPFIVVKVGDYGAVDAPVIGRLALEIYVYDEPGAAYWKIDRIIKVLKDELESYADQFAVDSQEGIVDCRTDWEYITGELFDDELNKAYKMIRFGVYA